MHVAIVGAGALGRVYGARLARLGGVDVSFVVRAPRAGDAFVLERVDERDDALRLKHPALVVEIPKHADVIVVCVRGEQLDDALVALVQRGPDAPVVVMTPMLPEDFARLRAALGARVLAAMPSVVAYARADGVVRYWLPRVATTLIDEPAPPIVHELTDALTRAGIASRIEMGVHESNPATTVTFIPLAMALDAAGGVDALMGDDALLDVALHAASEGHALATRIGRVATWASLLTKFVGRTTLKIGVGIAKHQAPEAVAYVDEHFGRKLHAQNVAMAAAIVALAEQKGTPHHALTALRTRLTRA